MSTLQRDDKIDFLKGLAIFLVVLGHINAPKGLTDFIYSFHMPLFMFLSGCTFQYSFSKKTNNGRSFKAVCKYILQRALKLLLPWLSWSIIFDIYNKNNFSPAALMKNLIHSETLWFLPALFVIITITGITEGIIYKWYKKENGGVILALEILIILIAEIVMLFISVKFDVRLLRESAIYLLPFFIGMCVKKYEFILKLYTNQAVIAICMIASAVFIPLYDADKKDLIAFAARYIAGISFTELIYCFVYSERFTNYKNKIFEKLSSAVRIFGKHSLEIYIVSGFFGGMFPAQLIYNSFLSAVVCAVCSVSICIICIVIAEFIRTSDIAAMLLLGERKI